MKDYREVQRIAWEYLAKFPRGQSLRRGGKNFITPDLLGLIKVNGEDVEVSTGVFLEDRLFGVTFQNVGDERSKCFHSWDEVTTYLDSLIEQEVTS